MPPKIGRNRVGKIVDRMHAVFGSSGAALKQQPRARPSRTAILVALAVAIFSLRTVLYGPAMSASLAVLLGLPDPDVFGAPRASTIDVGDIGLLLALLVVLGSLIHTQLTQYRAR